MNAKFREPWSMAQSGFIRRVGMLALLTIGMLVSPLAQAKTSFPLPSDGLGSRGCRPIAKLATPIAANVPCPGVRPGAIVVSPIGQCTMNFVYGGSDGRNYIGTAGHCVLDRDGVEKRWRSGGPAAMDWRGNVIGRFAYARLSSPYARHYKDFALIRLNRGVRVLRQMCHFGGPIGQNNTITHSPVVLHHFGAGLGMGYVSGRWSVPGRTALAPVMGDPDVVYAAGSAIWGDSGSGVIDSKGRAVGVLVHLGFALGSDNDGVIGITRMRPQILRAGQLLGIRLTLKTAALH